MERLTEKQNGEYILPCDGENLLSVSTQSNIIMIGDFKWETAPHVTCLSGKFINKLGELEDVMEKYGIDNLEDFIKEYSSRNIKLANDNYDLEQELAELKEKAIVLEKAFELACDPRDDWGGKEYSGTEFNNYHDYFIAEAEQELAKIKGGKDE